VTGPEDLQSNRVRVPGVRPPRDGYEMFTCPVGDCEWRKTVAEVEIATAHVPIKGSGPALSDAIHASLVGRAKATEQILRDHLESHDVIDFLRTIRDLEQQVYNAGHTGVRPHRRTTEMPEHELVRQRDTALTEQWVESYDEALLNRKPLPLAPHRLEDMTGEQRGRAAETLQRYEKIDRGPGWP
jgi:hypothetical protein